MVLIDKERFLKREKFVTFYKVDQEDQRARQCV